MGKRSRALIAILVMGLLVLSAGCIGGGSEKTSTPTKSPSQTTWNQKTASSTTSTTTGTTATTPTHTTTSPQIPQIFPEDLEKHIGENVSVEGALLSISYNSSSHSYILTISGTDVAIKVVASRDLLDSINPLEAGTGSKLRITGEVKSGSELVAAKIEVITPNKPPLSRIEELSSKSLGEIVVVQGNIEDIKTIGSNLKLKIDDGTGEITVFIPGSVVKGLSNETLDNLKEGLGVTVGGYLDEYRGELEVIPYTASAIKAHGKPLETETTTTTTTQTETNTQTEEVPWVNVSQLSSASGTVQLNVSWVKLYYSRPNYLLEVSDDSGTANLTVERSLIPNPLKAGTGSTLHLIVDTGSQKVLNLSVITPQPSPLLPTVNITEELMGKTVVVQGEVENFQTIGSNLKFLVVDGYGNITVFVPSSVVSKLPEDVKNGLQNGAKATIGGYVTEYRGTIEVVPYSPEGIELSG